MVTDIFEKMSQLKQLEFSIWQLYISLPETLCCYKHKGRVHCFSKQVVMDKYFFLNPEKNSAQIRLVVSEENEKTHTLYPKNDVTEPKARLLTS